MEKPGWNPYFAGGLTGLLAVVSVFFTGKYLGASTSFVRTAGMIEQIFAPEHVANLSYFAQKVPKIEWQWMFAVGILLGALISSITSGSFSSEKVPPMWKERFGGGFMKRAIFAFLGGTIALFGARLAGGCPSGHGLSGMMQMSVSAFIALICFFLGGVIMARILSRGERL